MGALTAMVVHVVIEWTALPERIPSHFNAAGQPDAWGGKNNLLLVPGVAAGLWVLLTILGRLPGIVNLPFKVDRSAPEVRAILMEMTAAMKATAMLVFAVLNWLAMRVALGQAEGLGTWFLPVMFLAMLGIPGAYLARLWRYRQPM